MEIMSTSIEDPESETNEDLSEQNKPQSVDDIIDHDDEKSSPKHSLDSPAGSGVSKNSCTEDLDTDLSATEVKSPENSKTDPSLKRSRKRYQWIRRTVNKELWGLKDRNEEEKKNFSLKISNFPTDWSLEQIKDVIDKDYSPVDYLYMAADDNMCFIGIVKLDFISFSDCQKAWEILHGKIVEDIKLFAEMRDLGEESDDEATPTPKKQRLNQGPWRPDIDIWDTDPRGLYGFKPEYLESLGIKPPIDNWVFVTNFRSDKSELKEVMELAGQVLICTVDTRGPKIGKVMYSHPLEAVQAVSMLNNQQFYGQPLKVTIESCPMGTTFLPKGLLAIGPGLGTDAKPLRDIVKHYERFINYKRSFVNTSIFHNPEALFSQTRDDSGIYIPKNVNELCNNSNNQNVYPFKQFNLSQNFKTQIPGNFSSGTNLCVGSQTVAPNYAASAGHTANFSGHMPAGNTIRPMNMSSAIVNRPMGSIVGPGPMAGPGPMEGPGPMMAPGPMAGPRPVCGPGPMSGSGPISCPGPMSGAPSGAMAMSGPAVMSGPGPMAGPGLQNAPHPMATNCSRPMGVPLTPRPSLDGIVELSNLPLSTTFPLLCEKMAECGQVMTLQLTTPGCAVVKFSQRQHAERCYQQYNKRCILGNVIEVKFL